MVSVLFIGFAMVITPEGQVATLLLGHAKAFAAANSIEVAYPNVKFKRDQYPYIQVDILPVARSAISTGNLRQISGLIQITVITDKDAGIIQGIEWVGRVSEHFRQGTVLFGDGLRVTFNDQPRPATYLIENEQVRHPVSFQYLTILQGE